MMPPPAVDVAVMSFAMAADEASTRVALSRCASCYEAGTLRQPYVRYGAKAVVVAAGVVTADQLRKGGHKGWAKVVRWSVVALYMGVAAHNLQVSR
jgi:hypothetical protein